MRSQLKLAEDALASERDDQYSAYRQLVELERVLAFDDVARGIEHDLYNALTPVEGYTELLLAWPERLAERAQAVAYLKAILDAARDAKLVVGRLRDFYYSTGDMDIERHQNVSSALADALKQGDDLITEAGSAGGGDVVDLIPAPTETLSPREWDVLHLLADGLKNKEIANTLGVSENTVKTHIKAILSKLSLKNRTQAAAYALLDNQAYEG